MDRWSGIALRSTLDQVKPTWGHHEKYSTFCTVLGRIVNRVSKISLCLFEVTVIALDHSNFTIA